MRKIFGSGKVVAGTTLLLIFSLFYSCRKPDLEKKPSAQGQKTMSASVPLTISVEEILAQLPQTMVHNLSTQIKCYVGQAEWKYEEEYLIVRIPLNQAGSKSYLYAVKPNNDPTGFVHVYLYQYLPETGSKESDFSGRQMWINFQDWNIYGVEYSHNAPTAFMSPIGINPVWEKTMYNAGLFYLDNNGQIAVLDNPLNPPPDGEGQVAMKGTADNDRSHGDELMGNGKGAGFFGWLFGGLGNIINGIGDWLGNLGSGNGNGGSDWSPSGPSGPPNWGGGGYGGGGYPSPPGGGGGGGGNTTPPPPPPVIRVWGNGLMNGAAWATLANPGEAPVPVLSNGHVLDGQSVNTIVGVENATVTYVSNVLGLDAIQVNWVNQHIDKAIRIKSYLLLYIPGLTQELKREIVREHLLRMMTDQGYLDFVNNYDQNNTGMWWTNEDWLQNPDNFRLTPNSGGIINAEELLLVALYPTQAQMIFTNSRIAFAISASTGLPDPYNGKQDAFRHAFFQAINVRDVLPRVFPVYLSSTGIVTFFANAHENNTPSVLHLEKEMDLYNNFIGIQYCWNCVPGISSNTNVKDAILTKISNGELKYLTPLDFNNSASYDLDGDGVQDCPTCLNGIIPATQIKPTNQ